MKPEDHNFIIKYLSDNQDAVDKMLALSWIVQAWKTIEEICEDNVLDENAVFLKFEKNCPIGVIKVLLEIDNDVIMRDRDEWIVDALTSGKTTNQILKTLIAGSREPKNFDFGG